MISLIGIGEMDISHTAFNAVYTHDYYPFGSSLEGRSHSTSTSSLQVHSGGYQGQEQDKEIGLVSFELRQYNSQLGRWLTPDPYRQHWSPYVAMSNNPISFVDPDGGYDSDSNPADGLSYDNMGNREVGLSRMGQLLNDLGYLDTSVRSRQIHDENGWFEDDFANPWKPGENEGEWIAEKGDGAWTLAEKLGITYEEALEIMDAQDYPVYVDVDGVLKSAIDPDQIVFIPPSNNKSQESIVLKKTVEQSDGYFLTLEGADRDRNWGQYPLDSKHGAGQVAFYHEVTANISGNKTESPVLNIFVSGKASNPHMDKVLLKPSITILDENGAVVLEQDISQNILPNSLRATNSLGLVKFPLPKPFEGNDLRFDIKINTSGTVITNHGRHTLSIPGTLLLVPNYAKSSFSVHGNPHPYKLNYPKLN